jgi:hypothetical protein
MSGPDDSQASTRPISVAELLAKNGTIGAPPVGGRRRRRRGNSDAVTVAELTGEIPIVRTGAIPVISEEAAAPAEVPDTVEDAGEQSADTAVATPTPVPNGSATPVAQPETKAEPQPEPEPAVEAQAEPEPEPESEPEPTADAQADTKTEPEPEPAPRTPPERASKPVTRRGRPGRPERSHNPRPTRKSDRASLVDRAQRGPAARAELMSPDPIDETEVPDAALPIDLGIATATTETAPAADVEPDEFGIADTSYLHDTSGALFGGETVADDLARRGNGDVAVDDAEVAEALDDEDAAEERELQLTRTEMVVRCCWIVLQSVIAVAFGAGLFIAFDQLWKWNSIVALVLGVIVILALVVGVRIVRKTEDIGSTLTAVAVGALVTFGPLALLQAN